MCTIDGMTFRAPPCIYTCMYVYIYIYNDPVFTELTPWTSHLSTTQILGNAFLVHLLQIAFFHAT